jgi:hypothetical protein
LLQGVCLLFGLKPEQAGTALVAIAQRSTPALDLARLPTKPSRCRPSELRRHSGRSAAGHPQSGRTPAGCPQTPPLEPPCHGDRGVLPEVLPGPSPESCPSRAPSLARPEPRVLPVEVRPLPRRRAGSARLLRGPDSRVILDADCDVRDDDVWTRTCRSGALSTPGSPQVVRRSRSPLFERPVDRRPGPLLGVRPQVRVRPKGLHCRGVS